jgi:3-phenylpropionate/trans-cinnamate dioxygenase ferredoxin subunit
MDPVKITIRNNGPYVIEGDDMARVRLVDHEGNVVSTEGKKRISLCRCGASALKPFCDGTHSKVGFQGAEAARAAYDAGQTSGGAPGGGAAGGTPAAQG